LDKIDDQLLQAGDEEGPADWSVSLNCAHMHPQFGQQTPEQVIEQMKQDGEVDLHYEAYKEKSIQARRSPYPTIVIEVRAVPPPDFGQSPPPPAIRRPEEQPTLSEDVDSPVSADDIRKLEALFGKSARVVNENNNWYDTIGETIEEVSLLTPIQLAQSFISENDPAVIGTIASFTETNTAHVDEAYEFVFTNLAMMCAQAEAAQQESSQGDGSSAKIRQYLVMPHFLSCAATSFEKFSFEVQGMMDVLPDLKEKVSIDTYHPEHVDSSKRSPFPVFVLQWNN
jgi:hypothetical protein